MAGEDFSAAMSALLETDGKYALERIGKLLRRGGLKKIKKPCKFCNQINVYEIEMIDTEEQRQILAFLSSYSLAKPKDSTPAPSRTLPEWGRLDEVPDEDLFLIVNDGAATLRTVDQITTDMAKRHSARMLDGSP